MRKPRLPKINSIHFGGVWLAVSLLIGGALPLASWLMLRVIPWPLCAVGGVMLLGFAVVLAVEMHQDFGRVPYYERHLAEDIPFDRKARRPSSGCPPARGRKSRASAAGRTAASRR